MLARNFLLDGLVSVLPRRSPVRQKKPSVMLVRLDAIGDFVLWLDAGAALRDRYPSDRYRLVLVANSLWADLASQQPFFDQVISVDVKRLMRDLAYRFDLWWRLRCLRCEVAVNPTFSRHFPCDDAVIRVCGASERIGFQGDLANQRRWEMAISNRWYTRLIPAVDRQRMELERNAEFVRGLGLSAFRPALPELVVAAGLPAELAAERYHVVVLGAGKALRQWPVEKYAALVQRIWDVYRVKAVICGARGEEYLGYRLQSLLPDSVQVTDLTGSTTLAEFAAVIKGAEMLVANESSAIHIAAAVGTRSICLTGGGHYGRFVPYRLEGSTGRVLPVTVEHRMECYNCNWTCIYPCRDAAAPCLEGIDVDEVWRKVQALLEPPP